MATPIAGDPPMLDAILEFEMSCRLGLANKIRKCDPCYPVGQIHIPIMRREIGGVNVAMCSSPIMAPTQDEWVDHYGKQLSVENASMLAEDKRLVVATGNSTYKSYRLPLRVRRVDKVVWFCKGTRRAIKSLLRSVTSLGKKRSQGYGRVARWELEYVDGDSYWFADSDAGRVLMRPLPQCGELPSDLIGCKQDFGACAAPYWHPERYREIMLPC